MEGKVTFYFRANTGPYVLHPEEAPAHGADPSQVSSDPEARWGSLSEKDLDQLGASVDFVLVDTREPARFAEGHTRGAVNFPIAGSAASSPYRATSYIVLDCTRGLLEECHRQAAGLEKQGVGAVAVLYREMPVDDVDRVGKASILGVGR